MRAKSADLVHHGSAGRIGVGKMAIGQAGVGALGDAKNLRRRRRLLGPQLRSSARSHLPARQVEDASAMALIRRSRLQSLYGGRVTQYDPPYHRWNVSGETARMFMLSIWDWLST